MTTLEQIKIDRLEAEQKIAALQQQRGAAIVDGDKFDDAELVHLQRLLSTFDDAEGAIVARQNEATVKNVETFKERCKGELYRLEETRLEAVTAAEKHCRGLIQQLGEILDISAEMRRVCLQGQFPVPSALGEHDTESRLGMLLSALFRTIPRHPARFGAIRWLQTPRQARDDWADHEHQAVKTALKNATNPKTETDL